MKSVITVVLFIVFIVANHLHESLWPGIPQITTFVISVWVSVLLGLMLRRRGW